MKKHNSITIKNEFLKKGFVLQEEYNSYSKPMLAIKDGYKYMVTYKGLVDNAKFSAFGARCPFQSENIKLYIEQNYPNITYVKCRNAVIQHKHRTIVTLECQCGNLFDKEWTHLNSDNHIMCTSCAREQIKNTRKKRYNSKFLKMINDMDWVLLDDKENLYANEYVNVEDKNTGYRGRIKIGRKYKNFLVFSVNHNVEHYLYNLNVLLKNNLSNSVALDVKNDDDITFKCGQCGKIFKTNISRCHKLQFFCQECCTKSSKNEILVQKYLQENNIEYIPHFVINSCRDKNPLPFDIQLPKYNVLIEIDGEQHFKPVLFGGQSTEYAQMRFEIQKKHDRIKNEYCKKYNIPLLRLSYLDFNDLTYQTKINSFLNTI